MKTGKKFRSKQSLFRTISIRTVFLLILGLAGTWVVFCITITGVTRSKNPEIALKFIGSDGAALANFADQTYTQSFQNPPDRVRTLALAALRQQAINPKALRNLGYLSDAKGNPAKAEQLIRRAAKLSRRETGAQMWLIEAEARKGNTKQTLAHYDIAMRTKPDTHAILFPRLVEAIEDPAIRDALKPYFKAEAPWTVNFLYVAVATSVAPSSVVDLIIESGGVRDPQASQEQQVVLLNRLIRVNDYASARRFFLTLPGAKSGLLTRAGFAASDQTERFGPLGWQITSDANAGGGFAKASVTQRAELSVFANSGITRAVARKTMYLKPGQYRFDANLTDVNENGGGYIRWQLSCRTNTGDQLVWSKDGFKPTSSDMVTLPSACPVQLFEIVVSGGNMQGSFEATIADMKLKLSKS